MKTESTNTNDGIWNAGVELPNLAPEVHNQNSNTVNYTPVNEFQECFPVIGGCQVSSILSHLNTTVTTPPDKFLQPNNEVLPQTMDLIVLPNNDYKITSQQTELANDASNFILVKDNITENNSGLSTIKVANLQQNNDNNSANNKKSKSKEESIDDDVENILYFVCNLCPYLCIKDSKITEHLASEHKNKHGPKLLQLKCPACPNIFYHKVPLRSHLIHDHKVNSSDLKRIIQAVVYFAKKGLNNATKSVENNKIESTGESLSCKNEMDLKYIEKLINSEKIIHNEDSASNDMQLNGSSENGIVKSQIIIKDMVKVASDGPLLPETVSLPMIDITHNDPAKTFSNMIKKRPDTLSKLIDHQKYQKCSIPACKVRLQDPAKMTYHITCHDEESFCCPECKEVFAFWKPLTSHLWRLHKIDMELYSCDECDYKTFSLGKLNNIHKLIHSDFRAFVCEICQKAFKNSKQLRNHKPTHKDKSDKLIHICEICAKPFSDRRQLRIHMDGVHNKIKPFLCSYCGYKGASKGALKMHIRQHTGEKPFACDICDYTTADHNSLRRHKLRHTGHKPYKCAYCDYACIQSSTYKVHLRTKHPGLEKDLLFTCQECQFKTVNKEMYLSHLFVAHRQKADI